MVHIFIQSSVDGNLGCFHVLAIVNSVLHTLGKWHVSLGIMVFSGYMKKVPSLIARESKGFFFFIFLGHWYFSLCKLHILSYFLLYIFKTKTFI